jgi:hypothetical protein
MEGISSVPTLHSGLIIRNHFGEKGNFELLVPQADGNGFAQFWSDNDNPSLPWLG